MNLLIGIINTILIQLVVGFILAIAIFGGV